MRFALALVLAMSVAACANLPSGAPTEKEFSHPPAKATPKPASQDRSGYTMIDLDLRTVRALADYQYPGLAAGLGKSNYSSTLALLPGDVVAITVFDVGPQPSAGPAGGGDTGESVPPTVERSVAFPTQVIDLGGTVKVPYGDLVYVAGMTPTQAARQIEQALKGQTFFDPQVIVSVVSSALDAVTVGGAVQHPGVIPLTVRNERVLDVVAAAGGAKYEPYDCDVELIRRGSTFKVNLQAIVDKSTENVSVEPGDSLYILHNPLTFSVLGSALKVSQYNFDMENVTLAEAVARAGGPSEATANIENVYLLRFEAKALVESLASPAGTPTVPSPLADRIPVAYHLDLRHGGGYFLAQAVQVRDRDVILMTNADADQVTKILALVRGVTGIYYDVKRTVP